MSDIAAPVAEAAPARPFAHLHCHTHYSLLDGASKIPELVKKVKELGMDSCAITDHGNLYGALEFYTKCKDGGVNPILGYEAYIAPGHRTDRSASRMKDATFHLTLLAMNATGFKNLSRMASKAYLEGFYYKPRIDKELLQEHNEGIICLSGCASSELSRLLLGEEKEKAEKLVQWYVDLFGDRFYMEIQDGGVEIQQSCAEATIALADRMGLPLVATNDAHYMCQSDAAMHDVLLCVNTKSRVTDENRLKIGTDQLFIRSPEQMYAAFPHRAEAVARSQEIANRCNIELDLKTRHYPVFTPPPPKTDQEYLREVAYDGVKWRYGENPEQKFIDRLEFELGVINKMGYASYFLIVWDFARFARTNGIPCTARGSACGAIVAYLLGISDVCPIEYDLLFERFLDPSRTEAPDIDMDFCRDRREMVLNYVKEKYGVENVAQIGTFGTLKAKAAIRDVARALGVDLKRADEVAKMIPETLNITIKESIEENPELKQQYQNDPQVKELVDFAIAMEGLAKSAGTHAAGVVISDKPLIEYVPLQKLSGKDDILTQWTEVEKAGLLKMDFLGLRNLSILDKAVQNVKKHRGVDIVPKDLPLDDKETFALLQRGETKGIFQLESGGMRDLLTKMKPDKFADIIATSALYRPGPLEGGMVMTYVNVKHGREPVPRVHPIVDGVLDETYGVMVYQEQVMRILNRLGGVELAKSYQCIKAISKKKYDIIAKYKEQFLDGAEANGMPRQQADDIFSLIEKFAGYGFNKCVVGETEIVHAKTGAVTTVGELFRTKAPFEIHAKDAHGRLVPRRVTDVVWNGRKRTFRVTTRQGKSITATANHPFWTMDGWKNLEELQPGDRIAAARALRVKAKKRWPEHEVIVLAGLLSEGNTCHPTCLYVYNDSETFIEDFRTAASRFPNTVARLDRRADGRRMEVCLSTGQDFRFKKGQKPWNASGTATAEPPTRTRCGAFLWAEKLGILGLTATEKRIPPDVFELNDAGLELFLGRMWAGDGFVGKKQQMPFYATSSRELAQGIQKLLLRLGIFSGVRQKFFSYRYRGTVTQCEGFTVHLVGSESVRHFAERVLPHAVGRESQVRDFLAHLKTLPLDRTSKDTVPASVRTIVNRCRIEKQIGWRELEAATDLSMREFACGTNPLKTGFRRSTIGRLGEFFNSRDLTDLAQSDIFWDAVESIEPQGVQDTYDLTVEEHHNFVADGLIVHNSHSTAYGAIAYQTAYLKAHYPQEFMAALLSCGMESSERIAEHTDDCRRMGIEILPPAVNMSGVEFTVVLAEASKILDPKSRKKKDPVAANGRSSDPSTAIRKVAFGMGAIRGVGEGPVKAICEERERGGPFKDIFDLCERIDGKVMTKGSLELLIKAGGLDSFGPNRVQHMQAVDRAMQAAASKQRDKAKGQKNLFEFGGGSKGGSAEAPVDLSLPPADDWTYSQKLAFEKEVIGFYLTSHPLSEFSEQLQAFTQNQVKDLRDLGDGKDVLIGGMVSSIKKAATKKPSRNGNSKYINFDLEDPTGVVRCIQWPDDFAREGDKIVPEAIILVRGRIDLRSREPNIIVNKVMTLEQAEREFTKQILIKLKRGYHDEDDMRRVRDVLTSNPGKTPVVLVLETWEDKPGAGTNGHGLPGGDAIRNRLKCYLTTSTAVSASQQLKDGLMNLLGPKGFLFQGGQTNGKTSEGGGAS
jgi:DNA polymerase-3 subunit alpha